MDFFMFLSDASFWMAERSYDAYKVTVDIPLLSDSVSEFFWEGYQFFHRMGLNLRSADSWSDVIQGAIEGLLSWFDIRDYITREWSWITDFWGNVGQAIAEWIRARYAWLEDIAGKIWETVGDAIVELWHWVTSQVNDLWSYITNHITEIWKVLSALPETITQAIWEWFTINFWGWLKDRAEQVVNIGGEILDLVW